LSNITDVPKPIIRILIPGDDLSYNSFLYSYINFSPKEKQKEEKIQI